jgi:uncharacterized protein (TIGR02271 family)
MARKPAKVVALAAEKIALGTRRVAGSTVRVRKVIRRDEKVLDQPVSRERVRVKRVPVNRFVDAAVPVRREGDTIIVSLIEEVPVVDTRLLLREELHITNHFARTRRRVRVTVRREEPVIERDGAGEGTTEKGRTAGR